MSNWHRENPEYLEKYGALDPWSAQLSPEQLARALFPNIPIFNPAEDDEDDDEADDDE